MIHSILMPSRGSDLAMKAIWLLSLSNSESCRHEEVDMVSLFQNSRGVRATAARSESFVCCYVMSVAALWGLLPNSVHPLFVSPLPQPRLSVVAPGFALRDQS